MFQLAEEDCQCLSHGPSKGMCFNPTLVRLSCSSFQSKAVLVLLSLGKFYKALDMLYR